MSIREVVTSPDGREILRLTLPEANYRGFHKLMETLFTLACFDKKAWFIPPQQPNGMVEAISHDTPYQRLESILMSMPLFSEMFRPEIIVSNAHTGTSPGQHTWKVFERMPIDHFGTVVGRLVSMVTVLFHDTGKAANLGEGGLAREDHFHDHAHISGYILRELLREYLVHRSQQINTHEAEQIASTVSLIVELHHSLELVERNILSVDEIFSIIEKHYLSLEFQQSSLQARDIEKNWLTGKGVSADALLTYLSPAKIIEHLGALTIADRQSAARNSVFVLTTLKVLNEIVYQEKAPPHLLAQIEAVITQGFYSLWQMWQEIVALGDAENLASALERVAIDFGGMSDEKGRRVDVKSWQSTVLRWIACDDSRPLGQHLGVK
jgi:CRISPR/Cas system-associated endonuclease Cas3-HD